MTELVPAINHPLQLRSLHRSLGRRIPCLSFCAPASPLSALQPPRSLDCNSACVPVPFQYVSISTLGVEQISNASVRQSPPRSEPCSLAGPVPPHALCSHPSGPLVCGVLARLFSGPLHDCYFFSVTSLLPSSSSFCHKLPLLTSSFWVFHSQLSIHSSGNPSLAPSPGLKEVPLVIFPSPLCLQQSRDLITLENHCLLLACLLLWTVSSLKDRTESSSTPPRPKSGDYENTVWSPNYESALKGH